MEWNYDRIRREGLDAAMTDLVGHSPQDRPSGTLEAARDHVRGILDSCSDPDLNRALWDQAIQEWPE